MLAPIRWAVFCIEQDGAPSNTAATDIVVRAVADCVRVKTQESVMNRLSLLIDEPVRQIQAMHVHQTLIKVRQRLRKTGRAYLQ